MGNAPREVYITNFIFRMFWIVIALSILIIGRRNKRYDLLKNV